MRGRCQHCRVWRSRLYRCAICNQRLCGCCSVRSTLNDVRLCCYPGDRDGVGQNAVRVRTGRRSDDANVVLSCERRVE